MSTAEEDISALLDEMEMENYVPFLQDDTVFQELSKLDLPDPHQIPLNESNNFDHGLVQTNDSMEFHDALDYFHNGSSTSSDLPFFTDPPSDPPVDHSNTYQHQLSDEVLLELLNATDYGNLPLSNTYPPPPLSPTLENGCGFTTNQTDLSACVSHDHTYATPMGGSTMLTTLSGACLSDTGKGSDSDEGSTSDTGYDTMGTSPASTRSSFSSSTKEPSVSTPNETSPTHSETTPIHSETTPTHQQPIAENVSQLLVDPVKLIDDRIKFFMNRHEVDLTEEEKDTLRSEGLPIPTTLPLTKTEEKALKSVRRKIRNKLAAQESRKKKKQYVHCLEEKVQQCTQENRLLHKKVYSLETENKTLLQQLTHLQLLVARASPILGKQVNVGTCLMVVVLCFGVLFGNLLPYRVSVDTATTYSTSAVRSRSLLSMDSSSEWFKWSNYLAMLSPSYSNHAHYHSSSATPTSAIINTLYYTNNFTLCSS